MRAKQTPGFTGTRLKEARGMYGLTASAFAELVGVSKQALSLYENNKRTPDMETLTRMADKLGFPVGFFFIEKEPEQENSGIFFRSMSSATKRSRQRAECQLGWLREISSFIENHYIELPEVNMPEFEELPHHPEELSRESINACAIGTRRFWGLQGGPISNVVWLLENNGCVVARANLQSDQLDGLSRWRPDEKRPLIVLNSEKENAVRSRFDAAHELGHCILHRYVTDAMRKDKALFKLIEKQAHQFASSFLFPELSFLKEAGHFSRLESFLRLKPKWKLSVAFMVRRARDLGTIDENTYTRLFRSIARRGWKKKEPLDEKLTPEQPRLLERCLEMLLEQGVVSRELLMEKLPYRLDDLAELTNIPKGLLLESSIEKGLVIQLKEHLSRAKPDDKSTDTQQRGEIVPFRLPGKEAG